jgi:hypothetical protein
MSNIFGNYIMYEKKLKYNKVLSRQKESRISKPGIKNTK